MDYIYILISFCFALLSTPITFSILDLLTQLVNVRLSDVYGSGDANTSSNTFIRNAILFSIFVSYWLGIFIGGRKWTKDLNNKNLRMIIVTIICMSIGMFFALSGHYKVFTMTFGFLTFLVRNILKYLGPFTILALAGCQIFYANQSFHRKDNTTDDYNKSISVFKSSSV